MKIFGIAGHSGMGTGMRGGGQCDGRAVRGAVRVQRVARVAEQGRAQGRLLRRHVELVDRGGAHRDAVLGGPVEVPTPGGPVRMRIPPRSDSGTELLFAVCGPRVMLLGPTPFGLLGSYAILPCVTAGYAS